MITTHQLLLFFFHLLTYFHTSQSLFYAGRGRSPVPPYYSRLLEVSKRALLGDPESLTWLAPEESTGGFRSQNLPNIEEGHSGVSSFCRRCLYGRDRYSCRLCDLGKGQRGMSSGGRTGSSASVASEARTYNTQQPQLPSSPSYVQTPSGHQSLGLHVAGDPSLTSEPFLWSSRGKRSSYSSGGISSFLANRCCLNERRPECCRRSRYQKRQAIQTRPTYGDLSSILVASPFTRFQGELTSVLASQDDIRDLYDNEDELDYYDDIEEWDSNKAETDLSLDTKAPQLESGLNSGIKGNSELHETIGYPVANPSSLRGLENLGETQRLESLESQKELRLIERLREAINEDTLGDQNKQLDGWKEAQRVREGKRAGYATSYLSGYSLGAYHCSCCDSGWLYDSSCCSRSCAH